MRSPSYLNAGVDIDAGDALIQAIKPLAQCTVREGVLSGLGGFGALFELSQKYTSPILVSSTDGVGTKLRLAFELNCHNTVGIDLVAMSVNDILVQGAEPLFFLDYFACSKLDVTTATTVIAGIAKGCEIAGCTLIGGETAEMPGMYPVGEYDLAGFAVGVVEKDKRIHGQTITPGDIVLGLASSGIHANGFSLVRKILANHTPDLNAHFEENKTLADVLIEPTRIYVKPLLSLMKKVDVKGLAHITGGGLIENIPRILPSHLKVNLAKTAWSMPAIFHWLQNHGNIALEEMYRVFNCGIGMLVIVSKENANIATKLLCAAGETVFTLGHIDPRDNSENQVLIH